MYHYTVNVLVQLPDGECQYLPIVRPYDNEVVKHISKKDAKEWAEFILPDVVEIKEVG